MFLTFANVPPLGLASTNSYGWIFVWIVVGILVRILVENLERILVDTALPSPNSQLAPTRAASWSFVLSITTTVLLLLLLCLVKSFRHQLSKRPPLKR